jgi:hypothetical protein
VKLPNKDSIVLFGFSRRFCKSDETRSVEFAAAGSAARRKPLPGLFASKAQELPEPSRRRRKNIRKSKFQ